MKLESEIVALRKYLEKANEKINKGLKLKGGSYILEELISTQNPTNKENFGLGLEKGMSSFVDTSTNLYERFRAKEKVVHNGEKFNKKKELKDENNFLVIEKYDKEKKWKTRRITILSPINKKSIK